MNVKELRTSLGMTQLEFSKSYNIPLRTLQSWEGGKRKPPEYVIQLLGMVVEYHKIPSEEEVAERILQYQEMLREIREKQEQKE